MVKKVISLLITIIFVLSLTACTPQIIVNTNDASEPQLSSVDSQIADSAQSDDTTLESSEPQSDKATKSAEPTESSSSTSSDEKTLDSKQEESKNSAATENTESAGSEKSVNSEQTEKETSSSNSQKSENTASEKTESQKNESSAKQATGSKNESILITKAQVKEIAFEHAKVNEADVYDLKVEYDCDDGIKSYEIEFEVARVEYEYDIHAETGAILKAEKDGKDFKENTVDKAQTSETLKTADEAKAIAFAHAGVTAESVYDLELELDRDNGKEVYEIEFKSERVEYKYELEAKTGEILKTEKENDD